MRKLGLLLLLCGLAGCPPPVVSPPEITSPALGPDEAVARVVARRESLSAVRARVPADLRFGGQEISTDLALILERPDRVRADALGLFGPLVMIALDGDRLTAFDAMGDRHLSGQYPEGAARAELPIPPLASDDLLNLLLGTPLDGRRARQLEARPSEVRSRLAFSWRDDAGRGEIVIHDQLGVPLSLEWQPRWGGTGYSAKWSWHDGGDLPRRAEISFGDGRASLVVRWGEIERNPTLDDALFTIAAPAGVERIDLDRLGRDAAPRR